jgi:transcriptional regulator of acetoin/glycerol metabolism
MKPSTPRSPRRTSPRGPKAPTPADPRSLPAWKKETLERLERAFLQEALAMHRGNVSRAARALGIHRSTLQRSMRRHRLTAASLRQGAAAARHP